MSTPIKVLIVAGVVTGTYLVVKAMSCKDCRRMGPTVSQTRVVNSPWLDTPIAVVS